MKPDEGLIGAIGTLTVSILAWLGYQRGRNNDKTAKEAGVTDQSRAGMLEVIKGLQGLVERSEGIINTLQEDNTVWRGDLKDVRKDMADQLLTMSDRLTAMTEKYTAAIAERDTHLNDLAECRREVERLKRQNGV